jgi:hypothetical protein
MGATEHDALVRRSFEQQVEHFSGEHSPFARRAHSPLARARSVPCKAALRVPGLASRAVSAKVVLPDARRILCAPPCGVGGSTEGSRWERFVRSP